MLRTILFTAVLFVAPRAHADNYCALTVAAQTALAHTKHLAERAREILHRVARNTLTKHVFDPPNPLIPPPQIGSGPFYLMLPYEKPPPEALKGFFAKAFFYDPGWLANYPVRKISTMVQNPRGVLEAFYRTLGYDIEIPAIAPPPKEYAFAPFRAGVRPLLEPIFNRMDRAFLAPDRTFNEVVRFSPILPLMILAYQKTVTAGIEYGFDVAGVAKLRASKLETIMSDPEFRELAEAIRAGRISGDAAIERLDLLRLQFENMTGVIKILAAEDRTRDPVLEFSRRLVEMASRKPPGSALSQLNDEQLSKLTEEQQEALGVEEAIWQARVFIPETQVYLKYGPPPSLPREPGTKMTAEAKARLVATAIGSLLLINDMRRYFEEWKGEPPKEAEQGPGTGVIQYFSAGPPSRIREEFKAGGVTPRQAAAMTVEWETVRVRLQQWKLLGVRFQPGYEPMIVDLEVDDIIKSRGDPSLVPKK